MSPVFAMQKPRVRKIVNTTISFVSFILQMSTSAEPSSAKPRVCLNMIVKNESQIIARLLKSCRGHIDQVFICDTGSTDNTEEIVRSVCAELDIPCKIIHEEFQNFGHNRNISLRACAKFLANSSGSGEEKRETRKDWDWYILLLDADMIVSPDGVNLHEFLSRSENTGVEAFSIQQSDPANIICYNNIRLVAASAVVSGNLSYKRKTHEYLGFSGGTKAALIDPKDIRFVDISDGGCKSDKYERDEKILLQCIAEYLERGGSSNPETTPAEHARDVFYLGNTYFDSSMPEPDKWHNAAKYYKMRVELSKTIAKDAWAEETFYSMYRIGLCELAAAVAATPADPIGGALTRATAWWLRAFEFHPWRIEGLFELIRHCRVNKQYRTADMYYTAAHNIVSKHKRDNFVSANQYIFLHKNKYTHELFIEYLYFAAHIGKYLSAEDVLYMLNNAAAAAGAGSKRIYEALQLLKFYKKKHMILPAKQIMSADQSIQVVIPGGESDTNENKTLFYSSSSALISAHDTAHSGYVMNIRYVNYLIDPKTGRYHYPTKKNGTPYLISINKWVKLSEEFKIVSEGWFPLDCNDVGHFGDTAFIGLDDLRIHPALATATTTPDPEYYFIGNRIFSPLPLTDETPGNDNNRGKISMVIGKWSPGSQLLFEEIHYEHVASVGFGNLIATVNVEKNWVFAGDGIDTLIYKWSPLTILSRTHNHDHTHTYNYVKHTEHNMPPIFAHVRGSTCGFINPNPSKDRSANPREMWFICHLVSSEPAETPRHYYHMVVVLDSMTFQLLRYSAPFSFEGQAIEYCLSAHISQDGATLIANYSTWDKSTRIGFYNIEDIEKIMIRM